MFTSYYRSPTLPEAALCDQEPIFCHEESRSHFFNSHQPADVLICLDFCFTIAPCSICGTCGSESCWQSERISCHLCSLTAHIRCLRCFYSGQRCAGVVQRGSPPQSSWQEDAIKSHSTAKSNCLEQSERLWGGGLSEDYCQERTVLTVTLLHILLFDDLGAMKQQWLSQKS